MSTTRKRAYQSLSESGETVPRRGPRAMNIKIESADASIDGTAAKSHHQQVCLLLQAGMGDDLAEDTETEPTTSDDEDAEQPPDARPVETMRLIFKPEIASIPEATRQSWPANSYAKRILDTLAAVGVEYAGNQPASQLPILLKLRHDISSASDYRQQLFPNAQSLARHEAGRSVLDSPHSKRNAFQKEHEELLLVVSSLVYDLRDAITVGDSGRSSNLLAMKEVIRGLQSAIQSMLLLVDAEVDARKGIKFKLRENGVVVVEGVPL